MDPEFYSLHQSVANVMVIESSQIYTAEFTDNLAQ